MAVTPTPGIANITSSIPGQPVDALSANLSGGYIFNPSTIKYAIDIMELETMISSKNRYNLEARVEVAQKRSARAGSQRLFCGQRLPPTEV